MPFRFSSRPDSWLSGLMSRACLNVSASDAADNVELRRRLDTEPVFASAKVTTASVATVHELEHAGFRAVDVLITYEGASPAGAAASNVRFARATDRDAVVGIARRAFRFTRFHLDPDIPDGLANEIKGAWAGNYFTGARGEAMIVAESDGVVCGFLQALKSDDALVIDLIAVDEAQRGRGLARNMIGFAAREGFGNGTPPKRLRVGTQAANLPSLRLYESLNLRTAATAIVLHHHGCGAGYPTP